MEIEPVEHSVATTSALDVVLGILDVVVAILEPLC